MNTWTMAVGMASTANYQRVKDICHRCNAEVTLNKAHGEKYCALCKVLNKRELSVASMRRLRADRRKSNVKMTGSAPTDLQGGKKHEQPQCKTEG